jgi:HEAT repeat protein
VAVSVAAVLLALAARQATQLWNVDSGDTDPTTDTAQPSPLIATLQRRVGEHQSWRLEFDSVSTTTVGDGTGASATLQQISAAFRLQGRLHEQVMEVLPGGEARVLVWVDAVESAGMEVQGAPVAGTAEIALELTDTVLALQVDACGHVSQYAPSGEGETASHILISMIEAGYPTVCGTPVAHGAHASRHTPHGRSTDFLTTHSLAHGFDVHTERRTYEHLNVAPAADAGRADVRAEGASQVLNGRLISTRMSEQVEVSEGALQLLRATTTLSWGDVREHPSEDMIRSVAQWVPSGERVPGAGARRMMLQQRAGGLSGDTLLGLLGVEGLTGTLPDHNDVLWQAPARLELEPELVASVVELIVDENTSTSGRALMLDLLVQTRSETATDGAVTALQHPSVRSDRFYPLLLQRIGFVLQPTPRLVEWTTTLLNSPDFNERTAALYASGSLISTIDRSPDPDLAETLHTRVVQALNEARDTQDRVHGIRALANAARGNDLPLLVSNSVNDRPDVRAALASSLGSFLQPVSTETLLQLASDTVPSVQREAIAGLRNHELAGVHLQRLSAAVLRENADPTLLMPLLDLAKYYVGSAPAEVRQLCQRTLDHHPDARTAGAARELIRWVDNATNGTIP